MSTAALLLATVLLGAASVLALLALAAWLRYLDAPRIRATYRRPGMPAALHRAWRRIR